MFADHTAAMGVSSAEFFNRPWDPGVRRAKEMLVTSDFVGAEDAHRLGMVNQVVGSAELDAFTLRLAQRIAAKLSFALKLAKEAVNGAQDASARCRPRSQCDSSATPEACQSPPVVRHGVVRAMATQHADVPAVLVSQAIVQRRHASRRSSFWTPVRCAAATRWSDLMAVLLRFRRSRCTSGRAGALKACFLRFTINRPGRCPPLGTLRRMPGCRSDLRLRAAQ